MENAKTQEDTKCLTKTYKLVQFSVHIAGLFGELGPGNVSPHRLPLHVLIYQLANFQQKQKLEGKRIIRKV